MNRSRRLAPTTQRAVDAALILWTAAWLAMGVIVASELRGIAELSDTVGSMGRGVQSVGNAIRGLPLIGDQVAGPADELDRAGSDAVASARGARESARRVGVLLGVSIALIPTLPLLALYLPARYSAARERRALQRALAGGGSETLDELLAQRAVIHLPYHRLRRVSRDPVADVLSGRHTALADAELAWFGLTRRKRRAPR